MHGIAETNRTHIFNISAFNGIFQGMPGCIQYLFRILLLVRGLGGYNIYLFTCTVAQLEALIEYGGLNKSGSKIDCYNEPRI